MRDYPLTPALCRTSASLKGAREGNKRKSKSRSKGANRHLTLTLCRTSASLIEAERVYREWLEACPSGRTIYARDPMGDMPAVDAEIEIPELGGFLKSLMEEGRAVVGGGPLVETASRTAAALRQLHELAGAELGLEVPELSHEAALWAARLVYHLCQFIVCRDLGEEAIQRACTVPCPGHRTPAVDWSVDLTLRHLPRLQQLAQQLSQADPLVQAMREMAVAWPLSSVGVPNLSGMQIDSFIEHPGLRRLYADRILATGDASRLGDPRVDQLLRADLGLHHELAPSLAAKLFPQPA